LSPNLHLIDRFNDQAAKQPAPDFTMTPRTSSTFCKRIKAMIHPRKNAQGKAVVIHQPSQLGPLADWSNPAATACVVPDGDMPATINGVTVDHWHADPDTIADWEALAATMTFAEPAFNAPPGLQKAAGVVVVESDGRVWLVAPSNAFGGYKATFPKGRLDGKSEKAAALVEAFEESGLQVRLTGHLLDTARSITYTRYYLAERIGGNPADMGWESQAVLLAPLSDLPKLLNNSNDVPIVDALKKLALP
jgi:8-oxo-dGTP pyrophosphatase MutT (NUDIX family)